MLLAVLPAHPSLTPRGHARPLRALHGWRPPALGRRVEDDACRSAGGTPDAAWAHLAEIKDLHLADLIRQAEEHHRDRKPAPFPGDDSSGDRGALCQEYGSAPRACTPLETFTPILTCCHDTDIHIRFPRFPEELARTTYTQPGSSIPTTFHNTSRLPEQ